MNRLRKLGRTEKAEGRTAGRIRLPRGSIWVALAVLLVGGGLIWLLSHSPGWARPGVIRAEDGRVEGNVFALGVEFDARIRELYVEPGMQVTIGQTLAQLEDQVYRARLREVEARFQQAQLDLRAARRELERDRQLAALAEERAARELDRREAEALRAGQQTSRARREWQRLQALGASEVISPSTLEDAETAYLMARSRLQSAQAEVETAAVDLRTARVERTSLAVGEVRQQARRQRILELAALRDEAQARVEACTIVAPRSGWIVEAKGMPGSSVRPHDPILTLWPQDALFVTAMVSERQLTRIGERQPARIHFDAFDGETVDGEVAAVILPATGTAQRRATTPLTPLLPDSSRFAIRIQIIDPGQLPANFSLVPGLTAEVRILVGEDAANGVGEPLPVSEKGENPAGGDAKPPSPSGGL